MSRMTFFAAIGIIAFGTTSVAQPSTQTCPNGAVIAATATCPDDSEPAVPVVESRRDVIRPHQPAPPRKRPPSVIRPAALPQPEPDGVENTEPVGTAQSTPAQPPQPPQPEQTHTDLVASLTGNWLWLAGGGIGLLLFVGLGLWLRARKDQARPD